MVSRVAPFVLPRCGDMLSMRWASEIHGKTTWDIFSPEQWRRGDLLGDLGTFFSHLKRRKLNTETAGTRLKQMRIFFRNLYVLLVSTHCSSSTVRGGEPPSSGSPSRRYPRAPCRLTCSRTPKRLLLISVCQGLNKCRIGCFSAGFD